MATQKEIGQIRTLMGSLAEATGLTAQVITLENGYKFTTAKKAPLTVIASTDVSGRKIEREIFTFFRIDHTNEQSWPKPLADWYAARHPQSAQNHMSPRLRAAESEVNGCSAPERPSHTTSAPAAVADVGLAEKIIATYNGLPDRERNSFLFEYVGDGHGQYSRRDPLAHQRVRTALIEASGPPGQRLPFEQILAGVRIFATAKHSNRYAGTHRGKYDSLMRHVATAIAPPPQP